MRAGNDAENGSKVSAGTDAEEKLVALFENTSTALLAEKVVVAAGLTVKLIPVPRHISSDCGVCLRFPAAGLERVRELLRSRGLETLGVFPERPTSS